MANGGQESPWARFGRTPSADQEKPRPNRQEKPTETAAPESRWADLATRRGWDTLPPPPEPEPEGPGLLARAASWMRDLVTPKGPPRIPEFADAGMGVGGRIRPAAGSTVTPAARKTPTGERSTLAGPAPTAPEEAEPPAPRTALEADAGEPLGPLARGFLSGSGGQYRTSAGNVLETLGNVTSKMVPVPGNPLSQALWRMSGPMRETGRRIEEAGEEYMAGIEGAGRLQDVRSPEELVDWALFSIGQGVASTLPSIAGGVAGGAVAGPVGAAVGAAVPAFGMNLGELRDDLEREGVPSDDADLVASAGAVPMALLDALLPARIGSRATSEFRKQATKTLAKRLASGYARGALTEGTTEALQDAIKQGVVNLSTDRPVFDLDPWALSESFFAGGLTGGVLSSVSTAAERVGEEVVRRSDERFPLVELKGGKVPENLEASGMRFRPNVLFTDKAPVSQARVPRDTEPARAGMEFGPNIQFVDEAPVTGPRLPTDVEPRPRIRFSGEEGTAEARETPSEAVTPPESVEEGSPPGLGMEDLVLPSQVPKKVLTRSQRAVIGSKIDNGTATEEERELFRQDGERWKYVIGLSPEEAAKLDADEFEDWSYRRSGGAQFAEEFVDRAVEYVRGLSLRGEREVAERFIASWDNELSANDDGTIPEVTETRKAIMDRLRGAFEDPDAVQDEEGAAQPTADTEPEARTADLRGARYIAERDASEGNPLDADAFRNPAEQRAYEARYRELQGERGPAATPAPEPEPAQSPPPAPSWQTRQPTVPTAGVAQETLFPGDNRKVPTRYAVMEAEDLRASHTPDFTQRPPEEFPPEIQGRAYHGTRGRQAREYTEQIVSGFDPDRALDPTLSAAEGPPVVTPQGIVVAGNGRVLVLQRLPGERSGAYAERLAESAERFGVDPETVRGMNRPVLVRVLTDESAYRDVDELRKLNAASDVPTGKTKDVLSDAASRADQFRASTAALDHFASTVEENQTIRSYLETAAGRTFLRELVSSGVIASSERARYIDASTGTATEEGKQMVERLFYAAAIGDPDVVARAPAASLRKLDTALPAIIRADRVEGWQIGPQVRDALDLLASAQATDQTVDDLVAQVDLTRPLPDPAVADMARFLEARKKADVRDAFRGYAKDAEAWSRQTASDDLFGYEPRSPEEARQEFAALVPMGPIGARFRHFALVPPLVKAVRAGEIHPLAPMEPMTDLFGNVVAEEAEQGDLLGTGGIQGMSAAVSDARAVVSQLEGKVERGAATNAEKARYEEARTVIRAHERRGLDKGEIRARRPEGARQEPDDTLDMFGGKPLAPGAKGLHPLQQASERLPQASKFREEGGQLREIRSPTAIIGDLRDALAKAMQGLKAAEGRIPRVGVFRGALGVFKPREHVVRLTDASDIVTFGHEAGHAMQKLVFGLDEGAFEESLSDEVRPEIERLAQGISDESLSEGWAEFWRRYLDNPDVLTTQAPRTVEMVEKVLADLPGVANAWIDARQEWALYRDASPQSRIRAKINKDEDPSTLSISERWSRARTNYLDDFEPLRVLTDFVRGKAELQPGEDVELLARLTRGSTGQALEFLEGGTLDFSTLKRTGKSLKEILQPVEPMLDDFRDYIVARRAAELHGRGILTGIRDEDAKWVIRDLEEKWGESFKPAFDGLQEYNQALLRYLVNAGVISPKAMGRMLELNENYVPFYRVVTGERGGALGLGFGHLFSPVKRIRGSGRDLIDPIESIVKNTMLYTHLAAKQQVSTALATLAQKEGIGEHLEGIVAPAVPTKFRVGEISERLEDAMPGFGELLEDLQKQAEEEWAEMTAGLDKEEIAELQRAGKLPDGPADPAEEVLAIFRPGELFREPNVISVLQMGRRRWYEVSPELYAALEGLDREIVPRWAQILAMPARLLRAGATLAPEFQIRNPARDQVMAYVQSEYGYRPYIDLARGIFELLGKGEAYQQWRASGGERAALLSLDRQRIQHNVKELLADGGVLNVVKNPLDALRAFSAFMEDGTRMGEFLRGRAVEAKRLGVESSELPKHALQRVAGASREVSIDFARHGAQLSTIRVLSAFWNARLQGYDRLAREFRNHPVRATTRAFAAITVPSLMEYFLNRDDEDYWELKQWRRDLFWNLRLPDWLVPGEEPHFLSWPKPFELGLIFGTLPTRMLEWVDTQDPEGLSQFFADTMMREAESMFPFPTVVEPAIEALTNYSFFFRRPLDPRSEEDVEPRFRGTEVASEPAKLLARWAPGEGGVSPRKIDNLLFSWTGGLGRLATGTIDLVVDAATGHKEPKRPILQRLPGVRGIIAGEEGFGSESIERFYREYERARSAKSTLRYFERRQMWREYEREIEDEEANRLRAREPALRAVADELASLRARRDQIRRDPAMDGAEKRRLIRGLGQQATEKARNIIHRRTPDTRTR